MEERQKKKLIVGSIIAGVIVALVICFGFFFDKIFDNEDYAYDVPNYVYINEKKYKQKNLTTYLTIGIDSFNKIEEVEKLHNQADFICAIIADNTKKEIRALSLSRDTITTFDRLGALFGEVVGQEVGQLSLSHTYGNDASIRNHNTLTAVTKYIFKGKLPINEYFAFTMGAVPTLNDFVGKTTGVPVHITSELADENLGLVEGDTIYLKGDEATNFVRYRSEASVPTNAARMKRQEAYISSYIDVSRNIPSFTYSDLTSTVRDYVNTNIDILLLNDFLSKVSSYSFKGILSFDGDDIVTGVDSNNYATVTIKEEAINSFLTTYIYDEIV